MDVSQLSVSIDVDMSGFMDAMEQLAAILETVAEEFTGMAKDCQSAFSDIGDSGEESKSTFGQVVDFVKEVVDIFGTLKDIIKGAVSAMRYFGVVSEDATATSLLGWMLELAGVSAELATPIGWIALGITSAVLAYEALYGAGKQASEQVEEVNKALSGSPKLGILDLHRESLEKQISGGSDNNGATPLHDGPHINTLGGQSGFKFSSGGQGTQQQLTNGTNISSTPNADSPNGDAEATQGIQDDFIAKANANYQRIKQAFPPQNADIKVKVDVLNIHQVDDLKEQLADVKKQMDELSKDPSKANSQELDQLKEKYAQLTGQIKDATDAKKQSTDQDQKQIDVSGMVTNAISGMASAIASVGQKGANPAASMIKALAGGMQTFGQQMIAIGVGQQLLVSLGSVAPPVLIAGGIALEIAGQLAMNQLASTKLAAGGIVSGSTFANIGEYSGASHNPEVVAPLDKLRNFIGNSHSGGHFSFELMGDKMVAALQRQSDNTNFVLGTNNQ